MIQGEGLFPLGFETKTEEDIMHDSIYATISA